MIDNYNKLSIGQFLEIHAICKDESLEEIDRQVKILAILADKTEEDILDLTIAEYTEMVKASRFLEKPDTADARIAKAYNLGGFCLVPCTDYRKIRTSQFIDFSEYSKRGEENMVEMLSCFLIPKGKTYNHDYDILDVQNAIRTYLSAHDVITLVYFFLAWYLQLSSDSLTFSREELQRMPEPEREKVMAMLQEAEDLMRNGAGLPTWTQ